jgi:phospholipase/lecithinase/hemolysin
MPQGHSLRLGWRIIQLLRSGLGLTSKPSSHSFYSLTDYGSVYYGFTHREEPSGFVSTLMNQYRPLIEQIYSDGIRKFLFLNCPPSTRSPQVHEENDLPEQFQCHAEIVTAYNEGLKSMLSQFRDEHKDVSTSTLLIPVDLVLYDSFQYMTRVLDDPAKYGYQDATCMNTDGSHCVWWNSLHPGWKYQQQT